MEKDKNNFTKILIILVIASLALLAIVYVFNKAQKNEKVINFNITKTIEKTTNKFNKSAKTILDLQTTERSENCGNFGCEPIVFTQGNWDNSEAYKLKFSHKNLEITIDDFKECSNEEYILPAYTISNDNEVDILRWNTFVPFYPCDDVELLNNSYALISEKASNDLDDYITDYTLIRKDHIDDVDQNSVEKLSYNDQEVIYYTMDNMENNKCFLLLGDEYQYNVCSQWEDNKKMLDNINILK